MLEARERRAHRQSELLETYRLPLISFTMNVAGPIKNGPLIRRGFQLGDALLRGQFARVKAQCVFSETSDAPTGCEGLYVVDLDASALKALTEELEESSDLGRLFDMDVLSADGVKLDRKIPRRCLICGENAKVCASRRVHSVEELQAKTHEILRTAIDKRDAETVGNLACRALLYEVCVTPKPGLVDRDNNGSHNDMDLYAFLRSSAALAPYFADCARIGRESAEKSPQETFTALRIPGKLAEIAMLSATGGANAHKGAIFSIGLICAALGRLDREQWRSPERILSEAASMTAGLTARDYANLTPRNAVTTGQKLYLEYGITGVRGQAETGFPAVLKYGLPVLERGLAMGKSPDEAGAAAMLSLLAHTVDTNMIARSDIQTQRETSERVAELLRETPYPDKTALERLDREFIKKNLSPGGSADLLALCWLLHFLREEEV